MICSQLIQCNSICANVFIECCTSLNEVSLSQKATSTDAFAFFLFFTNHIFYDFELLFNFWIKCIQKVISITSPVASVLSLSFTECSLFNDIFTTLNEIEVLKMLQLTEKVLSLNAHFSPSSSTLLVMASNM